MGLTIIFFAILLSSVALAGAFLFGGTSLLLLLTLNAVIWAIGARMAQAHEHHENLIRFLAHLRDQAPERSSPTTTPATAD